jgi:hypothetical protein
MLEPTEDLTMLFETLGDDAVFDSFTLKVIPGQMTTTVPDYNSRPEQSRVSLWLCATTQSLLEVGLLTPENRFDDVTDRVFALNGLTAEVLAITPDPTGFSLLGCSYV